MSCSLAASQGDGPISTLGCLIGAERRVFSLALNVYRHLKCLQPTFPELLRLRNDDVRVPVRNCKD
jgi:hypothetical protein